ncbi:MAG: Na+/H+ antiporter NhaC family protein [Clostridia bacterium]|nr:Na+/H+ antiporter NhaC family protein [Clostridia bacterium]
MDENIKQDDLPQQTAVEEEKVNKGNGWALLPIGVFLLIYIGSGIAFGNFYILSVVVAFMIAILVACIQNRKLKFDDKLSVMAKGVADKNIITMILIFLCSGVFAGTVGREGASAVADLMLSFIPAQYSALVLFVVSCFVSTAMGTSCGTITVIAPIGISIATITGISPALIVGSIIGGAMFGDNLSFISDTTIAATSTQGCKMKDKFKENFFIALPAAVLTIVILLIFALTDTTAATYTPGDINLWLIVPYVLVLAAGIAGVNVFIVLIGGIVSAMIINLAVFGDFTATIKSMGAGASGMFEVILVTVLVSMLSALMREYGGFDALLYAIKKVFRGKVGGQLGIATLVSAMDVATANNTVAIVMSAPIAKQISNEYGITNTKTASLLDIFGSVIQGVIPYGAQMVTAVSLTGVGAIEILPYLFYCYLLAISAIAFMFIPNKKIKKGV